MLVWNILLDFKVFWLNLKGWLVWVLWVYFLILVGLVKFLLLSLLFKKLIVIFCFLKLYFDFEWWKGILVLIIFLVLVKIIGKVLKKLGRWCINNFLLFLFLNIGWLS